MKTPATRPAPYRIFRASQNTTALVLQTRDPETGEAVDPGELEAYVSRRKLDSPWCHVGIPPRSRMLLTPKAARYLLAAGSIESLEEPMLITWSNAKNFAEPIAEAGRPKQSGTDHGPQGTGLCQPPHS